MLHIQIDPHSGIPVYRQVMDQIKYYMASGLLSAGDQLPSIRELSKTLSINPTTVVKAYSELEHAGAIESRQGKGVFITQSKSTLTNSAREKALRRLARQLVVEANQMGAPPDQVMRIVEEELDQVQIKERQGR